MESCSSSSPLLPTDRNCQLRTCDSCCHVTVGGGLRNNNKFWRTKRGKQQKLDNEVGQRHFRSSFTFVLQYLDLFGAFTCCSLVDSMFRHMTDAQAAGIWAVAETTTRGSELTCTNKRADPWVTRRPFFFSLTLKELGDVTDLDVERQSIELKTRRKLNDVELFGDQDTLLREESGSVQLVGKSLVTSPSQVKSQVSFINQPW